MYYLNPFASDTLLLLCEGLLEGLAGRQPNSLRILVASIE